MIVVIPDVIKAARIAGGFMVGSDIADAIGMTRSAYLRVEAGTTRLRDVHVKPLCRALDVSEDFLRHEKARSDSEMLAARLLAIFRTPGGSLDDLPSAASARLKQMRIDAGFSSTKAASEATGLPLSSLAAHEIAARPLSAEKMAGYALSFGVRPEFAILGEEPQRPQDHELTDWWRNARSDVDANAAAPVMWGWLYKSKNPERKSIPLVTLQGARAVQPKLEPITLPMWLLPFGIEDRKAIYGIVEKVSGLVRVNIIDPATAVGNMVAFESAGLTRVEGDFKDYRPVDPLKQNTLENGFKFGTLVATVDIHS